MLNRMKLAAAVLACGAAAMAQSTSGTIGHMMVGEGATVDVNTTRSAKYQRLAGEVTSMPLTRAQARALRDYTPGTSAPRIRVTPPYLRQGVTTGTRMFPGDPRRQVPQRQAPPQQLDQDGYPMPHIRLIR